ncbi:MAG TPA: hypothetical protein VGK02_10285 [Candidatus Aquicultor sp.]
MAQQNENMQDRNNADEGTRQQGRPWDLKEAIGRALKERSEQKSIMDVEQEIQGNKAGEAALEGKERRAAKANEKRFTMKEPQRTGRTEGSAR